MHLYQVPISDLFKGFRTELSLNSTLYLHEVWAQELYKHVSHSLSVAELRLRLKPFRCPSGALSHPAQCSVFNLPCHFALFLGQELSIWNQGPG